MHTDLTTSFCSIDSIPEEFRHVVLNRKLETVTDLRAKSFHLMLVKQNIGSLNNTLNMLYYPYLILCTYH